MHAEWQSNTLLTVSINRREREGEGEREKEKERERERDCFIAFEVVRFSAI